MIGIDIGSKSRRSRPAIGVRDWCIDSTDGINEAFELGPMDFSESAFVLQGRAKARNRSNVTASGGMKSLWLPERV